MSHFIQKLRNIQLPFLTSLKLYFDTGTEFTRIGMKGKGMILKEASYVGHNARIKEFIFYGNDAKTIQGKTPDFIKVFSPIEHGILSDFDAELALLNYLISKSVEPYTSGASILKPSYSGLCTVASIATEIEQKAVQEVLLKAGCRTATLVEKPIATAVGCGFNIFSHNPHVVLDIGAGLVEVSIISGGGIVSIKTSKNAGNHMNKMINNYVYLKNGIILGEKTCEELKVKLLSFEKNEEMITVRGKSLEDGLPKSIKIKSSDIREACIGTFNSIVDLVKELIEISPPEITDAIFKNGITVSGGVAGVPGLAQFIQDEVKIETEITPHYQDATLQGLIKLDKNPEHMYRLFGY